ncbi:MAG: M28 family peptidase [bacterium]
MRIYKIFLVLSLITSVWAQGETQRHLEADIRFLADDLLKGRGTPGYGLEVAALYLANQLRSAGWQPASEGSYFQTYTVREFSPQQSRYEISINGVQLASNDFTLRPFGMDPTQTPVRYDLIYAGYGVVAPERNENDLTDVDVRGKAVVAFLGAPWELNPNTPFGYDRAIGKSIEVNIRNGALLIYVSDELEVSTEELLSAEVAFVREMSQTPLAYLPEFKGRSTIGIGPILFIPPRVFDRTLAGTVGGSYVETQKRLSEGDHQTRALKGSVEIHIDTEPQESQASNVVAMLRGRDATLQNEWVVLSAHYDHLGFHEVPPGQDGIWNGADDNASGTAAVLEIARRLAAGEAPRRSVMILFTSGEERGLLGSAYYSMHPLVPYDRVVVNINVDMVGRSTGSVQGIAHGCEGLFTRAAEIGSRLGITVQPDQQPSWRILYLTDHYHFARFDVPAIEFFTGLHSDYHQPSDEVKLIRFEELSRILEVIYKLADYYAQGGVKPVFQRPGWFLTPAK